MLASVVLLYASCAKRRTSSPRTYGSRAPLAPIRRAIAADAGWVNTAGGPMGMPPLVAVTHSRLIAEQDFAPRLLACAELLLTNGADANCAWTNPKSPDPPQSALYGAAGRTHNAAMTTLLLAAGANPDDEESLYHSVETSDSTCMRLLLRAGARVTGTNALGRVLDFDRLDDLDFMLQHGGDPNERPWVHHAILRGRSMDHIRALVDAGADVRTVDADGVSLYRCAQAHGRPDVVAMLVAAGVEEPLSEEEQFVGACARGDEAAARGIAARIPDILTRLSAKQLQTMPELAAIGNLIGVRTMLALGWPLEVKSAWDATALNHAVFFGDAAITELLLAHGADWRARHAYRDNVMGTLSFASQDEVMDPPTPRDHVACARVLLAHGMPLPDGRQYTFSTDVTEFFDAQRGEAG